MSINITLPEQVGDLAAALFPLHREIESQYLPLPWPAHMQKIVVFTEVTGGRGDIAAAAKAIALMQRICPTLTFDWVLKGMGAKMYSPSSFLNCQDRSKVNIRYMEVKPLEESPADFILAGPVKLRYNTSYISDSIQREINGPTFAFREIAEDLTRVDTTDLQSLCKSSYRSAIFQLFQSKDSLQKANKELYQRIHPIIFPNLSEYNQGQDKGQLPMGLQPGSGVFLDQSRMSAHLSREYCCPSYLLQIEDAGLRKDILESMGVFDEQSSPDYDHYSFNSGYAHHLVSREKFIDCVAIHEKHKHVVIVLNQSGEMEKISIQECQDKMFQSDRLELLKRQGYGNIGLKGESQNIAVLSQTENSQSMRHLTLIIRPSFIPNDMKCMQFASERLLATGDNSAVEAWAARCKLYLYEDVSNCGCKWRFLQQQVDLAKTISPNLGRLLALFGGDRRLFDYSSINKPLNEEQMTEIEQLLNDPGLSDATLQFCNHITRNYSFNEVLEAALKRTAWHYCIPHLAKIEGASLDEEFQTGLVAYLKNSKASKKALRVKGISELAKRVQEVVGQWVKTSETNRPAAMDLLTAEV